MINGDDDQWWWWLMMMTRWRSKNQNQRNISHRLSTFTTKSNHHHSSLFMVSDMSGTSIAALQKSLIDAKPHKQKQDIVIRSEFNKGWVTKMVEQHPQVHIQNKWMNKMKWKSFLNFHRKWLVFRFSSSLILFSFVWFLAYTQEYVIILSMRIQLRIVNRIDSLWWLALWSARTGRKSFWYPSRYCMSFYHYLWMMIIIIIIIVDFVLGR